MPLVLRPQREGKGGGGEGSRRRRGSRLERLSERHPAPLQITGDITVILPIRNCAESYGFEVSERRGPLASTPSMASGAQAWPTSLTPSWTQPQAARYLFAGSYLAHIALDVAAAENAVEPISTK